MQNWNQSVEQTSFVSRWHELLAEFYLDSDIVLHDSPAGVNGQAGKAELNEQAITCNERLRL